MTMRLGSFLTSSERESTALAKTCSTSSFSPSSLKSSLAILSAYASHSLPCHSGWRDQDQ